MVSGPFLNAFAVDKVVFYNKARSAALVLPPSG
jgi:hypothetical protein